MNYLIVAPQSCGCKIMIVPEGTILDKPFESWALAGGKQILYTLNAMHRDLKQSYLWGSYQKGAMYATEYFDMCAIVTAKLGECDRVRYEKALLEGQLPIKPRPEPKHQNHLPELFWAMFGFAAQMTWGIVRLCAILLIFPFVIRWWKHRWD
jgi:hypothetical protein